MAKQYPPLTRGVFDTIHWLILEYIDAEKLEGQDEALKTMTPDILESEVTIEEIIAYVLDRMIIERGGEPKDRGNLFSDLGKKFKKDLASAREGALAEIKKSELDLETDQQVLMAETALLLSTYFLLAVSLEKENPLNWQIAGDVK